MSDKERLERIRRYLLDELELSDQRAKRAAELKDDERRIRWMNRYDTLYGVYLYFVLYD